MNNKYSFIRNYIRSYDEGITSYNIDASYGICSTNSLFGSIYIFHGVYDIKKENAFLAKAVLNQLSYNCCITYHQKMTAAEYNKIKTDKTKRIKIPNEPNLFYLHVCDSIPVMICSVIDRYLSSHFEPNVEISVTKEQLRVLMNGTYYAIYIERVEII